MSATATYMSYVVVGERVHIRMSGRHPKTLYVYVLNLPTTTSEDLGSCVVVGDYLFHKVSVGDAPNFMVGKCFYCAKMTGE